MILGHLNENSCKFTNKFSILHFLKMNRIFVKIKLYFCKQNFTHYTFDYMMKKIQLLLMACLLGGSMSLQAQEENYRHEISVGIGSTPNSEILDVLTEVSATGMTVGYATYENDKYSLPISAEYFYRINPLIGVGGVVVYTHNKRDVLYNGDIAGKIKNNYFTLMPAVKFNWLRKRIWGLYSKVALGASYRTEKHTMYGPDSDNKSYDDVMLNFQGTPIGVECGSSNLRGYIELGMGEQGIINAGLRLRL